MDVLFLVLEEKIKFKMDRKYWYYVEIFFLMIIYNWKLLMKRFEDEKKNSVNWEIYKCEVIYFVG